MQISQRWHQTIHELCCFCSSAEGRSAKSVGIATLCWWCHTTTHGGDVPCHVNMFSHVMFTFVTPPRRTCRFVSSNSQFICDEWWISRFIRFIQFSAITPKILNDFLWNDNHATSCDHPTVLAKVWNQRIIKIFVTSRCWSQCYHQCRRDSDPCWYVLMVISYFIFVVTYWTTLEVALFLELDVGLLKLEIYRFNLGHFGRFVSPVLDGCKGYSWVPQHLRC